VGDQRLGLVILPPHPAGVEAMGDIARGGLAHQSGAALAEQFLIAVADGAGIKGLVQRGVRILYPVPVAALSGTAMHQRVRLGDAVLRAKRGP
jgi:hypothetical protein